MTLFRRSLQGIYIYNIFNERKVIYLHYVDVGPFIILKVKWMLQIICQNLMKDKLIFNLEETLMLWSCGFLRRHQRQTTTLI